MEKERAERGERERERGEERERIKERSVGAEETTARVWQKEGKKRSRRSRPGDPQLYTRGSTYCTCVSRTREERVYNTREEIGEKERGDNLSSPRREEEREVDRWKMVERREREVGDEWRRDGCKKRKKKSV